MNGFHLQSVVLDDLGAVRIAGADVVRFLQGQLSNDLGRVSAQRSALAGLHNPQGRTIALLRIVQLAADDFLAVLPRELATNVAGRLSRYVLRAKVKVTDESQSWRISGLIACGLGGTAELHSPEGAAAALSAYPGTAGEQARVGEAVVVCMGEQPARWLLLAPAADAQPAGAEGLPQSVPARREIWSEL